MESNSKVIKVVKTCCSGRIRVPLSLTQHSPSSGRSVFVLLSPTAGLDSVFDSVFASFPGIPGNEVPAVLVYYGWIQTARLL